MMDAPHDEPLCSSPEPPTYQELADRVIYTRNESRNAHDALANADMAYLKAVEEFEACVREIRGTPPPGEKAVPAIQEVYDDALVETYLGKDAMDPIVDLAVKAAQRYIPAAAPEGQDPVPSPEEDGHGTRGLVTIKPPKIPPKQSDPFEDRDAIKSNLPRRLR